MESELLTNFTRFVLISRIECLALEVSNFAPNQNKLRAIQIGQLLCDVQYAQSLKDFLQRLTTVKRQYED